MGRDYKIDVLEHFQLLLVCGNCSSSIFYIPLFVRTYQFIFQLAIWSPLNLDF